MVEQAKTERFLRLIQLMSGPVDYTLSELEDKLEMARRTIYRYIETFKDAGFVVEKTGREIFRIASMSPHCSNLSSLVYFSEEEAYIVNGLIERLDTTNSLKAGLHRKLASIYDSTSVANYVDNKSNAANVDSLSKAAKYHKKAILHGYESGHSGQKRDRLVEPFAFTTNFIDVWAYDLEDGRNKVFKISRIDEAEMLNDPWTNGPDHCKAESDVFRMSGEVIDHIVLRMTALAKNLLLEEYPMSEKDIRAEGDAWVLETDISNVYGAGRFVLGLPADIKVVSGEKLKDYIKSMVQDYLVAEYQ